MKAYLGESLYVEYEGNEGDIILTTETDGETTNRIVMKMHMYEDVMIWVDMLRTQERAAS